MKISFFIFFTTSTLSLSSVVESQSPVLDTAGNLLVTGASYYILPAVSYRFGGVKLDPTTLNQTCPLDVTQEHNDELDGLPLTFLLSSPSIDGVIYQSTDLNIRFSNVTTCGKPAVWRMVGRNGQWVVTLGGIVGRPRWETTFNWFKIEKYDNDYKIEFCPKVCGNICRPFCGGVGSTIAKTGRISLILSKVDPLKVKFKKA
ncbi:proteinase inhibitor I3 [Artemisia annua]|uniref:Proteinase inhibitor I3 n=1 Tax=Artemisia annua TaxID=35608 RepID=A0A2U1PRH9_ARTAN|nr:proteinase inhibitor I3 [Artemisia annua]